MLPSAARFFAVFLLACFVSLASWAEEVQAVAEPSQPSAECAPLERYPLANWADAKARSGGGIVLFPGAAICGLKPIIVALRERGYKVEIYRPIQNPFYPLPPDGKVVWFSNYRLGRPLDQAQLSDGSALEAILLTAQTVRLPQASLPDDVDTGKSEN